MFSSILKAIPAAVIAAGMLLADFSYEQTTKITGGAMADMLKMAGVFSREAREPIQSTVAVKGDRMLHGNDRRTQIIDLAKETITTIDYQKKAWSVITFAEMTQILDQMSARMHEQGDMHFKVSANATGQARQIAGVEAKEMLLKMELEAADPQSGQQGSMVILNNFWMAPKAPGYEEVAEFHRRMAEKLRWTPGAGFAMARPDIAKGMAEVYKEMSKLDGMPVLQETRMTGQGQPGAPQAQAPSAGDTLGSVLGGRFGRLGRKKKDTAQEPASQGAPGSLLEMTTEMSNFSSAPVDPSRFEVPAGFKQVESELKRYDRGK